MTYTPRPYGTQAKQNVLDAFTKHRSTALVLFTGAGKTVIAIDISREFERTLFIAHTEELVRQPLDTAKRFFGIEGDLEKAEFVASNGYHNRAPLVAATIQTISKDRRLHRFQPDDFDLVVFDEAHRHTQRSARKVKDYFGKNPKCKFLYQTATPKRTDKTGLGSVCDSVAFHFALYDGIQEGWAVPVRERIIMVEDLDFSELKKVAGDFNQGHLEQVLLQEKPLHEMVRGVLDHRTGPTMVFCTSVRHAEMTASLFNRYLPGSAKCLVGKTDYKERRQIVEDFKAGRLPIMTGCSVFVEGFDARPTQTIAWFRPTLSPLFFEQGLGRGIRPLEGTVENLETAEQRRMAIEGSTKPYLNFLDFTGVCGKHKLVTCTDVLAGKAPKEAVKKAKERIVGLQDDGDVLEALAAAQRELAEIEEKKRQAIQADRAKYRVTHVDPFDVRDRIPIHKLGHDDGREATPKQIETLSKNGVEFPDTYTFAEASAIIQDVIDRARKGLCTYKQAKWLRRFSYDPEYMTKDEASSILSDHFGRR